MNHTEKITTTFERGATIDGRPGYHGTDSNGVSQLFTDLEVSAWLSHQLRAGTILKITAIEEAE